MELPFQRSGWRPSTEEGHPTEAPTLPPCEAASSPSPLSNPPHPYFSYPAAALLLHPAAASHSLPSSSSVEREVSPITTGDELEPSPPATVMESYSLTTAWGAVYPPDLHAMQFIRTVHHQQKQQRRLLAQLQQEARGSCPGCRSSGGVMNRSDQSCSTNPQSYGGLLQQLLEAQIESEREIHAFGSRVARQGSPGGDGASSLSPCRSSTITLDSPKVVRRTQEGLGNSLDTEEREAVGCLRESPARGSSDGVERRSPDPFFSSAAAEGGGSDMSVAQWLEEVATVLQEQVRDTEQFFKDEFLGRGTGEGSEGAGEGRAAAGDAREATNDMSETFSVSNAPFLPTTRWMHRKKKNKREKVMNMNGSVVSPHSPLCRLVTHANLQVERMLMLLSSIRDSWYRAHGERLPSPSSLFTSAALGVSVSSLTLSPNTSLQASQGKEGALRTITTPTPAAIAGAVLGPPRSFVLFSETSAPVNALEHVEARSHVVDKPVGAAAGGVAKTAAFGVTLPSHSAWESKLSSYMDALRTVIDKEVEAVKHAAVAQQDVVDPTGCEGGIHKRLPAPLSATKKEIIAAETPSPTKKEAMTIASASSPLSVGLDEWEALLSRATSTAVCTVFQQFVLNTSRVGKVLRMLHHPQRGHVRRKLKKSRRKRDRMRGATAPGIRLSRGDEPNQAACAALPSQERPPHPAVSSAFEASFLRPSPAAAVVCLAAQQGSGAGGSGKASGLCQEPLPREGDDDRVSPHRREDHAVDLTIQEGERDHLSPSSSIFQWRGVDSGVSGGPFNAVVECLEDASAFLPAFQTPSPSRPRESAGLTNEPQRLSLQGVSMGAGSAVGAFDEPVRNPTHPAAAPAGFQKPRISLVQLLQDQDLDIVSTILSAKASCSPFKLAVDRDGVWEHRQALPFVHHNLAAGQGEVPLLARARAALEESYRVLRKPPATFDLQETGPSSSQPSTRTSGGITDLHSPSSSGTRRSGTLDGSEPTNYTESAAQRHPYALLGSGGGEAAASSPCSANLRLAARSSKGRGSSTGSAKKSLGGGDGAMTGTQFTRSSPLLEVPKVPPTSYFYPAPSLPEVPPCPLSHARVEPAGCGDGSLSSTASTRQPSPSPLAPSEAQMGKAAGQAPAGRSHEGKKEVEASKAAKEIETNPSLELRRPLNAPHRAAPLRSKSRSIRENSTSPGRSLSRSKAGGGASLPPSRRETLLCGLEQELAVLRGRRDTFLEKHASIQASRQKLAEKMKLTYGGKQATGGSGVPLGPIEVPEAVIARLSKIARTSEAAQEHLEHKLELIGAALKKLESQRRMLLELSME